MAIPKNSSVEKAFGEYMRVAKPATPVVSKSITYTDAHTCPYCQGPMRLTSIRKHDGTEEPVYLCSSDRAVGVVPDSEMTT